MLTASTQTKEMSAFVADLVREFRRVGVDQRCEPRYPVSMLIDIQPVDELLSPRGQIVQAVTRDVSSRGIGLIHAEPVDSDYLFVHLTSPRGHRLSALVEVLRCRPFGALFEIGGRFVSYDIELKRPRTV